MQFGYGLNYLIDIENAVIVDVEATPARTYDEVAATKTMIDRTEALLRSEAEAARRRHGLWHGQVPRLAGQGEGITPHIPVWDKSEREDGTFSRSDFTFDKKRERLHLPGGKLLHDQRHTCTTDSTASTAHPSATAMSVRSSAKCCPNMPARQDPARPPRGRPRCRAAHDEDQGVRQDRAIERKRVEMRFAHLKTHHRFERMRLRGLSGARDEFHLAAIVQNLKTLANHVWPPPPKAITDLRGVKVSCFR